MAVKIESNFHDAQCGKKKKSFAKTNNLHSSTKVQT